MLNELKKLIEGGETKSTINRLLDFVDSHYARFASEVMLISTRYNQIIKDLRKGVIERSDYRIEINSITDGLLQIIESIEDLEEKNFKRKKSKEEVMKKINSLDARYDKSRKRKNSIKSNATRLREKGAVTRELGELFVNHPELIQYFYNTENDGVIAGIAIRFKKIPEEKSLDFFESVLPNITSNFTKCCITNALVEYIYSGQALLGDDNRIQNILEGLYPNSYSTIRQNINRVFVELEYFAAKS